MKDLTDKQKDVLIFLYRHYIEWHCLPTCQVMADHFGWASPNCSNDYLKRLKRDGYLEQKDKGYRFKI